MSDYKVTEQEQKQAEQIRRQYIPHEENKMSSFESWTAGSSFPERWSQVVWALWVR